MSEFDVDVVILWVDGNDKKWSEEKEFYSNGDLVNEGNGASRYRDMGTLRYWFRCIEKNMPWIRKIHFVTYGHFPEWLNVENPKIHIVRHSDFIPQEYLPTFSSHPIDLNLHRIGGLSDHFIYMNDDTFVVSKIDRDYYFSKSGLPKQLMRVCCLDNYDPDVDFIYTNFNNMGLINRNFKPMKWTFSKLFNIKYGLNTIIRNLALPLSYVYPGFYQAHMPVPFLKETFIDVWNKEQDYLSKTCRHRFRNYKDVNQWLMQYWQLVKGNFSPVNHCKNQKMIVLGKDSDEIELCLCSKQIIEICINDNDAEIDFAQEKNKVIAALKKYYPEKSEFEKG